MFFRPPQKELTHLSVYTWNPEWKTFGRLSLGKKIKAFKKFIDDSQNHFRQLDDLDSDSVCLIVAPDMIFAPPESEKGKYSPTYAYSDYEYFCKEIKKIQSTLDHHTLVIAGAIDYATKDAANYKITSHILSATQAQYYDKKIPTTKLRILNNKVLEMERGNKTGIISFNGRKIGLEICQDHEGQALLSEIQNDKVDIHVLLSVGQHYRLDSICSVQPQKKGVFIQCEREPGKVDTNFGLEKTYCSTETYSVNHYAKHDADSSRKQYFNKIASKSNKNLEDIRLEKVSSEVGNKDKSIKHSRLSMEGVSQNKKIINRLRQICMNRNWSLRCVFSYCPSGVREIYRLLQANKSDQQILFDIQSFSKRRANSFSFTRSELTQELYCMLGNASFTPDKLEEFNNRLNDITYVRFML